MVGRCALRLRQCIQFARKRGVLSRRSPAGSGSLVARHRQVHAPCEAETGNGHKRRNAKQADRHGVLGYKGARRKRLASFCRETYKPLIKHKLWERRALGMAGATVARRACEPSPRSCAGQAFQEIATAGSATPWCRRRFSLARSRVPAPKTERSRAPCCCFIVMNEP